MNVDHSTCLRRATRVVPGLAMCLALALSACRSDSTGAAAPTGTCDERLSNAIELLRMELPTYDYEPAADLEDLVRNSDLVVSGTISSAQRTPADDSGGERWTSLAISEANVLFDRRGETPVPDQLGLSSNWPEGTGPDPLAGAVDVGEIRFVSFLQEWEPAPGGFATDVQGLVVGCASSDDASISVIEPMPRDTVGLSIDELAAVSKTTGELILSGLSSPIDGPLVRHPAADPAADGEDALIEGVLELEDNGCLYLRQAETGERYPVIWPANTTWDADQQLVMFASGRAAGLTDRVSGGGAYRGVTNGANTIAPLVEDIVGPEAAALIASCLDDEVGSVAVVNNLPDAIGPSR